jgi:hypothetical protein
MSNKGGARMGAGRPKGAKDKVTREAGATIAELARQYTDTALDALAHIAAHGESEAARVAASNALLDRGYGKATLPIEQNNGITIVISPEDASL